MTGATTQSYGGPPRPAASATREERLAAAIAAIGSADFVPAVLDYLRSAVPFQGCLLTRVAAEGQPVHLYDNVRSERRAVVVDRYLDGAWLLDPFIAHWRAAGGTHVQTLRDVAPDGFRRSSYWKRYYGALKLADEAAIFVELSRGRALFYSIGGFDDARRRFARAEVRALRRELPVFAALNRRHFEAPRAPEAPAPALDLEAAMADFAADRLTDREREVAALILRGHSTKSVAGVMGISPGTVKIHRKHIHAKLNIASQNELFSLFLTTLAQRPRG